MSDAELRDHFAGLAMEAQIAALGLASSSAKESSSLG